jgi:trans-2,3-dihydro-3-hydroxyanthranilate isomerase
MQTHNYHLVDVFTETPFGGNPLAVFLDAEDLSTKQMQTIARELNLSESAFVMPSDKAEFRLRIFTPGMEVPMAGHPTVGTAYVLQHKGLIPATGKTTFEENVGVIPVSLNETGIFMSQPLPAFGAVYDDEGDRAMIASLLSLHEDDLLAGYPVQAVSTGVPFLYIPLANLDAIARIQFRLDVWDNHLRTAPAPHIFAFAPEDKNIVRSRMFAPLMGIPEDPATGAASGPLGAYLVQYGLADGDAPILSKQGYAMGRPSQIHIRIERDGDAFTGVQVGGQSVYMGGGALRVPVR